MPFSYINVDEAIAASGLRMMVVTDIPSPWGEAAKGIFHVKGIDWKATRLVYDNPALDAWAGQQSAPVAVYNDEAPRSGWAEILFLAERLAPEPSLIPSNAVDRALMFGLSHEILGEQGLGWSRRANAIHEGLTGGQGFHPRVAKFLAPKYNYQEADGPGYGARVIDLLSMLSARLNAQKSAGHEYLIGDALSAADIYLATTMALFAPLPEDQCAMNPLSRATFETLDDATKTALDPVLIDHRDMIYARHLALPLSL